VSVPLVISATDFKRLVPVIRAKLHRSSECQEYSL